ncbi:MAG TPA: hypothetical protein VNS34_07295 [Rhizobiaceae bacterium]|nr:hypothetical protein [Rhizobiaceae bacterium]
MNNIFNLARVRATRGATSRSRPLLDAVAKVVAFPVRDRAAPEKPEDARQLVAGWHIDHATRRLVCRWRKEGSAEPSSPCIVSSRLLRATLIGTKSRAA